MSAHVDGERLSAYLDGESVPAEKAAVEAHLTGCPSCRRSLVTVRSGKALLAAAPRRSLPPAFLSALRRRLNRPTWRERARALFRLPRVWIPTTAIAAAAASLAIWWGTEPEEYIPLEALSAAHARYAAESLAAQGAFSSADASAQLAAYHHDD
jgi:anti-sigma factor RsiW